MTPCATTPISSENRSLARLPMILFAFHDENGTITNANRQEIVAKLSASRILDVKSFLRINNPHQLVKILDPLLTYRECVELYRRICWHCSPQPVTALTSLNMVLMQTTRNDSCSSIHDNNKNKMDYFPTGLGLLDQYLRGGCRIGSLTEVVGCAGIGKSQLAMQMALLAVTMKRAGTILIDTESKISISRLQEMDVARNQTQSYNALSHIAIHTPDSLDALRAVLNTLEDEILDSLNGPFSVRLLIVDSIAAPIRRSEMAYSAAQQASVALGIAQTLKRLADQFRLVVLIINQVGGVCWVQQQQQQNNTTTHIHPHATIGSEPNEFNKNHQQQHIPNFNATAVTTTKAALGTAWHHCVSTRIRLDQPSQSPQSSHLENHHHHHHHRYATVVKSNVVAPSPPLAYRITNEGLVDEIGKEKHKVMDTRRQTFLGPIE